MTPAIRGSGVSLRDKTRDAEYLASQGVSGRMAAAHPYMVCGDYAISDKIFAISGRNFELCVYYTCGQKQARPQAGDLPAKTPTRTYPH